MQPPVPENRPVGDIPGPESNYLPPAPGLPPELNLPGTVEPPRKPGRIRQQDENTAARPETVAEARARQRAQRQRAEDEQREAAEAAEAARKKSRRRKQMIGAGVGVGVVGAIALLYVAIPDNDGARNVNTQTAYCTVDGQVVSDNYCSSGTYNPVTGFILLNGMSYRYNYGGNYNNGRLTGGSYDRPANTAFRTQSGAAVDPSKATSFGSSGQTNAGSKPAPPAANSGSSNKGSSGGTNAGSNSGKNIDRGGLGTSSKGGSSKGGSGSSGS